MRVLRLNRLCERPGAELGVPRRTPSAGSRWRTTMTYWLGIDLGTTYTSAAICRQGGDNPETQVIPLSSRSLAIPSVLFLPGDRSVVVGEGAERRAVTDADRVVREFKRRIGDDIP